jgi:O-antigen ligase
MKFGPRSIYPLAALLVFSTVTIGSTAVWPTSAVQCGLYVLAAACAVRVAWGRLPARAAVWLIVPALPAVCGAVRIATGTTPNVSATTAAVLQWTALFSIFAAGFHALADDSGRRRFLRLFLVFGVAVTLYTLVAPSLSLPPAIPNRNNFAALALLVLPVAGWQALAGRRGAWAGWSAAALLIAAVISSGSRAGSLLVLIETFALFAAAWFGRIASRRRLAAGLISVIVLAAAFSAAAGWHLLFERMRLYDPLEYRREIYRSTLAMIAERPWTGFGPGTFETVYPKYALFDVGLVVNYAHDDWLQWGAEFGVPVVAALAVAVAAAAIPAIRTVWGLGVVFVALYGIADFPMQRMGVAGWMMALLAAVAAAHSTGAHRGSRHSMTGSGPVPSGSLSSPTTLPAASETT